MSFEAIPQGEAVGLKLSTILLRLMYDPQCPGWRSSHSLLIHSAWIGALHEYDAARYGRWQREAIRSAEDEIVRRIHDAVIEQRLPPGTKLSEAALCDAFGVGRARVRRSLVVLAGREIVELHTNRGAFVARPTPERRATSSTPAAPSSPGSCAAPSHGRPSAICAGSRSACRRNWRIWTPRPAARHPALGAFPCHSGRDRRQPSA